MPDSFTTREQRVIVRYLKAKNTANEEVHKLLTAAAGPTTASYKDVKQWIQDLVEGKEDPDKCTCNANAANGSADKSGSTDPALICRIESLINSDRRITVEKAAELSTSSDFSVNQIFSSVLGLRRVYERWIPKSWTPDQRTYRVSVCKELNDMYNYGGVDFLSKLIVGDECLAFYHNSDGTRRTSNVDGRRPSRIEGGSDKFRPTNEPVMVNCIMFYDCKGVLVSEMMHESQSPTESYYAEVLKEKLLPVLKRKRNHTDKSPIYLLHDNTALHNSLQFQEIQKELNIQLLPHPTNSPDMEPQEYWFFKHLKKVTGGANFKSRADLWTALTHHIATLRDAEFNDSIQQLPERWNRIIENDGLYILN